jgi:SAM-dependent methyltransferase
MALERRSLAPELMDEEAGDPATLEGCLRDLAWINRWTFAYRITLRWLGDLVVEHPGRRHLRILDVGSGYGDMLRRIWRWAERRDLAVELIGVDRNPEITRIAAHATPPQSPIRYLTADVLELKEETADVVLSALFAHHLDDRQLTAFLSWMEERARLGWLINDLQRHRVAHAVARTAPHLLRMNRLVRHDAAVSVARSLDRRDWQRLLGEAGLAPPRTTIARRFPFRWAVSRIKPG